MATIIQPNTDGRFALFESMEHGRRHSSESSCYRRPAIKRKTSMPNLQAGSSSSTLPTYSDSPATASLHSLLKDRLDDLPTTHVFSMGNDSFDMLTPVCQPDLGKTKTYASNTLHLPTRLDPIIERHSASTLRNSLHLSEHQKRSVISQLSQRLSRTTLRATAAARRRRSFSLTDLPFVRATARFVCSPIPRSPSDDVSELDWPCYGSYPKEPVESPRRRSITPEGIPTFNTPEAAKFKLSQPRISFKEFMRGNITEGEREWRFQTSNLPPGVVMRGRDGTLVSGSWKPPESSYAAYPAERSGMDVFGARSDSTIEGTMNVRQAEPVGHEADGHGREDLELGGQAVCRSSWLKSLLCCFRDEGGV